MLSPQPSKELMKRLLQTLRSRFFPRHFEMESGKLAALRLDFKTRYHKFRLLLKANNKALEEMAAMEKALAERFPFTMSFIRATTTGASVNVFRMIRNLEEISPGRYQMLETRFNDIQKEIISSLSTRRKKIDGPLVMPFSQILEEHTDLVGSKMARLCEARNKLEMEVPDGFAVTAAAYQRFLQHNNLQVEINRLFQTTDFEKIDQLRQVGERIEGLIREAEIPDDLSSAIQTAYDDLEQRIGRPFGAALRSSALGEDLLRTSFAGLYRSLLNVTRDNIVQAYRDVLVSKYTLHAIVYRYNYGFRDEDVSMCVGCMEMVPAAVGGVAYSRDPINPQNNTIIINSAWGLPKQVVDGRSGSDQLLVSREEPLKITDIHTKTKDSRMACSAGDGIQVLETNPQDRDRLSLTTDQAIELTRAVLLLEQHFGGAQDIEWALSEDGRLHILQCRPLHQMVREERIQQGEVTTGPEEQLICRGGITASSGAGSGPVFILETKADMVNFPPGAVLVTRLALPQWATLLDRASAVITERGSFAGHLGNVAREYGVPALFEVTEAKKRLTNTDVITVDASQKSIFKGRIESLLTRSEAKKNLIDGSPVYETLKEVSRSIVPLHLIDPEATDFKPENCKTLHDITRFIHEKSILEIFNFGEAYRFSEKTSKQLFYKVPMKWWVLNLDDGFKREISERYVRLEDICSLPMIALWEGIIAYPWDGPPQADGRGLMSVMFQATANQSIDSSTGTRIADREYFMISKHFCSWTSRLGFHFSTVESIVSDETDENYIYFQYRGGAADFQRRVERVRFLGSILEEHGFITSFQEDALIARLEKREPDVMCLKLKIIGYLTLHSRQLDMIMANQQSVARYRDKFRRDIAGMR